MKPWERDWSAEAEPAAGALPWERDWGEFEPPAAKPGGGGFSAAAKQAVGSAIRGAGQAAADFIPGVGADNPVKRYGQEVIDANQTTVNSLQDIADSPGMAAKEATGNAAGSMAGMLGARAAGMGITAMSPLAGPAAPLVAGIGQIIAWVGPVAIAALPSYGGIRDKQILNDPAMEEDGKAKAIAALGAGTVGLIESKFGPQQWALSAMTREGRAQLAKKLAETGIVKGLVYGAGKGAAIEGAEELVQNPIEQVASFQDPTSPESVKETVFGGAMGAIGGGVLGGGMGTAANIGRPKRASDVLDAPDVDSAIQTASEVLALPAPGTNTGDTILATADGEAGTAAQIDAMRRQREIREAGAVGAGRNADIVDVMPKEPADPALPPASPAPAADPAALLERQAAGDVLPTMLESRRVRTEAAAAAQAEEAARREAELAAIPEQAAQQNTVRAALQRAGTLEAPTAMQLALERGIDRAIAPEPDAAAAPLPRIVPRTPEMVALSQKLAEQRAAATGGEVVRIRNQSGKFAFTVIPRSADAGQPAAVRGVPAGSAGSGRAEPAAGVADRVGADREGAATVDAGGAGGGPAAGAVPLGAGGAGAAVEPAATWFGRRGDGYLTQADAALALPTRQRQTPDLRWMVERMPNGKFRLAGYEREVPPVPAVAVRLDNPEQNDQGASDVRPDDDVERVRALERGEPATVPTDLPAAADPAGTMGDAPVLVRSSEDSAREEPAPARAAGQPREAAEDVADDEPQGRSYDEFTPEEKAAYDKRQGIPPGRREEMDASNARIELQVLKNRIQAASFGQKSLDGVSFSAGEFKADDVLRTAEADVAAVEQRIADAERRARLAKESFGGKQDVPSAAPATIQDIGEKIGGARKDTATSTGQRARRAGADDDRPTWAKRFQISQVVKGDGEGRWIIRDTRSTDWKNQPRQVGRDTFATKEEAEAFLPMAAVSLKHRAVPTRAGKYEIWRDINDRKRVKVVDREFDTRDEAMAHMAQHAVEILETNTTFGEADLPQPPDRARAGPQRRSGDVAGGDFMGTFGFRGVEFGNWNNQEERQALMNHAYDGLLDLADVLGLPPKALGLNGDLALAFGARGQGLNSARAHYENERVVINLTKENGAGSLAHEWFHALDHYFGRQDGKTPSAWKVNADGTRTLDALGGEGDFASGGFRVRNSGVREEVRQAYQGLITTIFKKATTYVEDTAKADQFTARAKEDLARDLDGLRKELSAQKDQAYWKRNNKPASAEQLAEFDAIATRMLEGEAQALATDWRSVETAQKKIAHRWTNDSLEQLGAIYKAVRGRSGFDSTNRNGVMDKLQYAMKRYSERLRMLADAQKGAEKTRMVPTDFAMNAKELDQGRGGDYWTTQHEMAARAFQGFVEDRIAERGGVSRFLNYAPENVGIITPWGFKRPYPAGEERKAINAALQRFVEALDTRETEQGVALFRDGEDRFEAFRRSAIAANAPLSVEKVRLHVDQLTKGWKNAPRIHVVANHLDLPVRAPKTARGFYNGEVWIVARLQKNRDQVARTLAHEAIAHHGLEKILGKAQWFNFQRALHMGIKAGNKPLREAAAFVDHAYKDLTAPERAHERTHEIAARVIEDAVDPKTGEFRPGYAWLKATWARVADWLRSIGIDVTFTTAELHGMLVMAQRSLEVGQKLAGGGEAMVAATREDGPTQAADSGDDGETALFARSTITGQPLPQTWQAPDASKLDDLIYTLQDKHVDTKRAVQAVRDSIGALADEQDPYLQEELFHGRAAKATKQFLDSELRPLLVDMQARGVELSDFEEYLHNRHAERRNVQVAKVNPNMPDGGSGIKTKDARAYLAGLPAARRRAYEALAKRVDAMTAATRKLLVDSGLEKQTTVAAWDAAYGAEYVPLMREEMEDGRTGLGQGYSVRGSASKRAMGSNKPVADIIANIAMQRERTITRAQKRRIGEALYGLVLKAPNDDFWIAVDPALQNRKTPNQVMATQLQLIAMGLDPVDAEAIAREPVQRYIDPRTQQVAERINPAMRSADNVLAVRVDGEDKFVFFNAKDPRAMRMVTALKNLDADQLGTAMGLVAKMTRWFASVNTQYNPIFGITNITRDVQGALLNLNSTPLADQKGEVMKHVLPALRGIYIDLRDHRAGKTPSSTWAQTFEEFQREGGATGYRDMYANAAERADAIVSELRAINSGRAFKVARGVFDWLSDYNEAMENAVRVSAYKVGVEHGLSKQQAASLAKNLTVNFNRKGQVALQAGALYAFFNAATQGTARIAQTMLKDGKLSATGQKILAGGLLLGVMQALLLSAAGFDDEEPPDFVRERSLVIPVGGAKYLSIPMPLGFHVIPNLGRIPTEWAMSGFKDTTKRVAQLLGVFADAFNPIGNAGLSLQTIAPTVIDPLAALAENKDWTGKPIAKKDFDANRPTAGHTRAKDTATPWAKVIAYGVNIATGGTDYKPGLVSPTPDQIDYLIGQVTGGVGREVGKLAQVASGTMSGEDVPLHKIPLVGRFVGTTQGQAAEAGRFYDNLREIGAHKVQIDGLRKDGRGAEIGPYIRENRTARLVQMATSIQRDVSELQKRKRMLIEKDAPRDRVKLIDQQITTRMKLLNDRVRKLEEAETTN